jgi:hypothetical protein
MLGGYYRADRDPATNSRLDTVIYPYELMPVNTLRQSTGSDRMILEVEVLNQSLQS